MDKLKLVEGERDQAKTKCTVLEKQLAAKTDVLVVREREEERRGEERETEDTEREVV